jgi:hypothetical protein
MNAIRFSALFLILTLGCSKRETTPKGSLKCSDKTFVCSVKNVEGIISYHADRNEYAIHSAVQGTYDSVEIGFICNMTDSLKIADLKVRFAGNYFEYDKDEQPTFGGSSYHYLDITEVRAIETH